MDELKKVIEAEGSNFTMEEAADLINYLNNEKNLDLEKTKQIIREAKPTKPDIEEDHLDHPHKPSTN